VIKEYDNILLDRLFVLTKETMADLPAVPRGRPKSGRVWKTEKKRFSEMVIDKNVKSSWARKMQQKAEKKSVMDFARQLNEDTKHRKENKRKRTEDNKKRRLANEKKSEVVQPIKNTAKIKRMKKKQLRKIEKR